MLPKPLRDSSLPALVLTSLVLSLMACGNNCTEPGSDCDFGDGTWNGSFECGCRPTLEGWRFGDPELAAWREDAPPGGGSWCLKLQADSIPPYGYAYASVPDVEDGDVVRLSAFVRAVREGGGGKIMLCVGDFPVCHRSSYENEALSTCTDWTHLSVEDSVRLIGEDSVWVVLAPISIADATPSVGLFDMVVVENLNK